MTQIVRAFAETTSEERREMRSFFVEKASSKYDESLDKGYEPWLAIGFAVTVSAVDSTANRFGVSRQTVEAICLPTEESMYNIARAIMN